MTRQLHTRLPRHAARTLMLAMLVTPTLSASEIRSHPDAHGGNRPSIHQSGNGTPVVDITTPGTDGVSHNVYQQLDVDERGVVFNNGRQTSATTLAGQIGANPALAGGTADLILNEVRAASPSQLAGYLEIGGDPADLVIANPAGITCNGCGFINAERAMLTTGKPRFDDGRWSGLDVRGGRIRVEGDGMDASRTAQADLLARAIEINAGIWADEVNVITGVGQFDLRGRLVGSAATDLPPPDWSIDTGQLGGMYANKIRLVANEHGVGVRNRGSLQAGSAGLILMIDGQLVNRGTLHSEARARLDGSSIDNHGTLQATDQLTVTSTKAFTNQGGRLSSGADLTLAASSIENDGTLQAGEDITLVSDGRLTNHQGQILAERDITVAARRFDNRGEIHANGTLEIQVASTLSNQSILSAVDSMHLTASNALNRGELLTGNDLHLLLDADLDNATGRIRVGREANVSASSFDNQDGLLLAGRAMGLEADRIDNTGGTIGSAGSLQASSRTLDNSGGELQAGDGLTLDTITLSGAGRWSSTTDLTIHVASDYDHEGELLADEDLSLAIDGELTNSGTFSAAGAATLRAEGVTNRADGKIVAGQLSLDASDRLDNHGLIDGGQVSLTATHVINHPGARLYGTDLSITAATLRNLGDDTQAATLAARDQMRLTIDTLENRDEALILSAGEMAISGREGAPARRLLNDGATIEALGALAIEADRIENRNAGLVTAQVDEAPVRESWIQLRGSQRTFDAVACSNLYDENVWCQGYPHEISDFTWFRTTAITSHTEVVETKPAVIRAGDDMTLVSDTLVNTDSQIIAGGELHADLGELDNSATQGKDITRRSGTASFTTVESCGTFGSDHCREWHGTSAYNPAPVYSAPYDLPTVTYTERAGANSLASTLPSPASGSGSPLPELPQASLFRLKLDNPNAPLVETDPRFASYRQWYGSQAMLDALDRDPAYTQKRLGDAFYEQALVREQVVEQTGQRHLDGFADDDAQFRALIDAGIKYGRDLEIAPGVRLTEKQLDRLATDIVWLEESIVTMDGKTHRVLAPRLYLADADAGSGSSHGLIAARDIDLAIRGTASNRGHLQAGDTLNLTAQRIEALDGSLRADRIDVTASNDIHQRGGEIVAGSALSMTAGRDINIEADTRHSEGGDGANRFTRDQIIDRGRLAVTGPEGGLDVTAGRDLILQAADITHDADGATALAAGRDLRLSTATEGENERIVWDADNRLIQGQTHERGSHIDTRGNLQLYAGRDLAARAAVIDSAAGEVMLTADDGIDLGAGRSTRHWEEAHRIEDSGFLSSSVTSTLDASRSERVTGTHVGGRQVRLKAGNDIIIQGSQVISDQKTTAHAGGDIALVAGLEEDARHHFQETTRSGLFSNGGLSITYGSHRLANSNDVAQQTSVPTRLASIEGDVNIGAGDTYRQSGSALLAPAGDIDIHAGRVEITESRQTGSVSQMREMEQSGLTLALTSPVIDAAKSIQRLAQAADDTDSGRMKRLAAASAGLAGVDAYSHIKTGGDKENANLADKAGGVSINISVGASESHYRAESHSDRARGSNIRAGGDVRISATEQGEQSDIVVRGSDIRAEGNASLSADDEIALLAAKSRREEKSENDSQSASVGIGIDLGSNGVGFSITASAARGEGESEASEVTHQLSHISAGETANLQSGEDTALVDAVVTGQRVQANVGGDLRVESVQDQIEYRAEQHNESIGVSIPIAGASFSASFSSEDSEAQGSYRSVTEQSAIHAGEGGFDLTVAGNTDLVGGVISSNADPADNRLITGTLTSRDLTNAASASAEASGLSLSSDMVMQGKYGAAKGLVANTALDADRSGESQGRTRSAIQAGEIIITDTRKQEASTGNSARQTIAALSRDTSNSHVAATQQKPEEMRRAVEADRVIKKAIHAQAVKFTDESYRTLFLRDHPMFQVVKDKEGKPLKDPETGKPVLRRLSEEEKRNLKPGPDGKVAVFTNGIFNDQEAAAGYSAQMLEVSADQPIYLIHFPEADNAISELLVAGYQKFMENDFWGLANATKQTRNTMAQFGNDGLYLSAHSRGAMTVGNAASSLSRQNNEGEQLREARFRLVGPAYNAQDLANRVDDMNGDAPTRVELQNHEDDLVGSLIGGNEATYKQRPKNSTRLKEWVRMSGEAPTVHSCYGNGAMNVDGCNARYGQTTTILVPPSKSN